MIGENPTKVYIIETKMVSYSCVPQVAKNIGGEKMKVSLAMLLKTNVEKMSEYRPLAMLMKTHGLKMISGDVDEIKGDGRSESNRPNIGLSGHRGICDFRFEIDDPRLRIGDLRRQN